MGVELSAEADLQRRVGARCRDRVRVLCKRCRRKIPESRRRDALYCCRECQSVHRREQATALRTEVRALTRRLACPQACPCGAPLNNAPGRHGPPAKWCKRCRNRESARRYRERRKAAQ